MVSIIFNNASVKIAVLATEPEDIPLVQLIGKRLDADSEQIEAELNAVVKQRIERSLAGIKGVKIEKDDFDADPS